MDDAASVGAQRMGAERREAESRVAARCMLDREFEGVLID